MMRIIGAAGIVLLISILLVVPDFPPQLSLGVASHPFRWDRAELFEALERDYRAARSSSLEATGQLMDRLLQEGLGVLEEIEGSGTSVPWDGLARLESIQFSLATHAATHGALLPEAQSFLKSSRIKVMRAARNWPVDRPEVHEAVYRVMYGGRTAIEEALAQTGRALLPALVHLEEIPSSTSSTEVMGVRVHSGDILLSRGGAPTSALIARGNDFPGNFSHIALVHVEPETGRATIIEALIEGGAVLSTPEEYLAAKKLRILLLRLRPEHPVLRLDPLAPHKAATFMLERVREDAIPYDFSMDWNDPRGFFCSEVPYHAYQSEGIDLWAVQSDISAPGLARWLAAMGVRHFTTLVPSDLEYDPRLGAVVEWRDVHSLRQERFDNATMDVLLEGAEQGYSLGYAWYHLPAARALKAWSVAEGLLGFAPTIPSGMSPSTALRVDALTKLIHPILRKELEEAAAGFREENGYEAPYWELIELAREVFAEHGAGLSPALDAP